jgi:uncharacterized membrane-anchored protein YitT (DUF2179 family)
VSPPDGAGTDPTLRHTWLDDAQALLTGALLAALGVMLLKRAGLVTGGTAGMAFVLHYASGWRFGALLFLVNLPFYGLAWRRLGARFTLKTFIAVSLLAVFSELMPNWIHVGALSPVFAALAGALLVGVGFVVLFRHQASLGGLNVLVNWLQETRGWRAGHLQLGLDLLILLVASAYATPAQLALSVLAAVVMNLALAINHRPGRYVAI